MQRSLINLIRKLDRVAPGRLLGLAIAAGLALRLALLAILPSPGQIVRFSDSDAAEYFKIGRNLLAGGGFSLTAGVPTAFRPPAYPLLIALCGAHPWLVLAAQFLIFALSAGLVWAIARRILGRPAPAFFAVLFLALYPECVMYDTLFISENLFVFSLLLGSWAALRLHDCGGLGGGALFGAAFALAALTRPVGLYLFPLVLAYSLWRGVRRGRWTALAAAVLVFAALIAPWLIRNKQAFGQPLFSTSGGMNLYLGNKAYSVHGYVQGADDLRPAGNEVERDEVYRHAALAWMGRHAGELPLLWVRKALRLWLSIYDYRAKVAPAYLGLTVLRLLFFTLAFAAIRGLRRVDPFYLGLLALLVAFFTLLHVLVHSEARYVMPLLPLLVIALLKSAEGGLEGPQGLLTWNAE